jgi:hypothetical protein
MHRCQVERTAQSMSMLVLVVMLVAEVRGVAARGAYCYMPYMTYKPAPPPRDLELRPDIVRHVRLARSKKDESTRCGLRGVSAMAWGRPWWQVRLSAIDGRYSHRGAAGCFSTDPPVHVLNPRPTHPLSDFFFLSFV